MIKRLYAKEFDVGTLGGVSPVQTANVDESQFVDTISYIIQAAIVVAGLILLIYLIFGSISYITSSGDDKRIAKAQKIMSNALVGFVILVLSWWIVKITGTIFGIDLLVPKFRGP